MLETISKSLKRAMSKSKLSRLKRIKKQLIKNMMIWGKNLLTMNEFKKNYLRACRQMLKMFCLQKKI